MGWGAALGSAFGGILNFGSSMSQQQAENVRHSEQMALARENIQLQKDFAQQGVRWKVEDAQAARIHPLFAMGASTHPFTPVSVGGSGSSGGMPDFSSTFSAMGQGIERAIAAGKTNDERMEAVHEARHMRGLQFERAELENTLLKTNIMRSMSQLGPPMPRLGQSSPGGGNSGDIITSPSLGQSEPKPPEVTTNVPGAPAFTSGPAIPTSQFGWTTSGALQPFPAPGVKVEDEFAAPLMARWLFSEAMPPNFGPMSRTYQGTIMKYIKDRYPSATGAEWSHRQQGFVPVFDHGGREIRSRTSSSGRGSTLTVPMPEFPGFGPRR